MQLTTAVTSPPRYAQNVRRFYLFGMLVNFHLWTATWLYYLQQERGLSLATVGLMEALAWIGTAMAEVPTGAIADTYGRRISLAIGGISLGTVIFFYGVVGWVPLLIALHIIWNLCQSFFSGADQAMLYDSLKADGREGDFTRASGRYTALVQATMAVAGFAGIALGKVNLALPFLICGVLVVCGGLWALTLKEPPREVQAQQSPRETWRTMRSAVVESIRQPSLRYTMMFAATTAVPSFFYSFFFVQPYGLAHHFDLFWVGALTFGMRGAAMVGASLSHRLRGFLGERTPLYNLPAVIVAVLLAFALLPPMAAIPLGILGAVYVSACRPIIMAMLNRLFPSSQRATFLSVQMLLYTIFLSPAQFGLSKLVDISGLPTAYLVLAACCVVIMIALISLGALRLAQKRPTNA